MAQPKKQAAAKKRTTKDDKSSTREALTELRTTLTRGVVLTRERINETLEDAVRRGRMTREDAEDLAASLVGGGGRPAPGPLAANASRGPAAEGPAPPSAPTRSPAGPTAPAAPPACRRLS